MSPLQNLAADAVKSLTEVDIMKAQEKIVGKPEASWPADALALARGTPVKTLVSMVKAWDENHAIEWYFATPGRGVVDGDLHRRTDHKAVRALGLLLVWRCLGHAAHLR